MYENGEEILRIIDLADFLHLLSYFRRVIELPAAPKKALIQLTADNHYTLFLKFARQYGEREEVDAKWQSLLKYEAEVIANLKNEDKVHG